MPTGTRSSSSTGFILTEIACWWSDAHGFDVKIVLCSVPPCSFVPSVVQAFPSLATERTEFRRGSTGAILRLNEVNYGHAGSSEAAFNSGFRGGVAQISGEGFR